MHIRTSRVRRNGKTYEYAQLVENYRRESDGLPVARVIATLGHPSDVAVLNLQEALYAAREGKRVAVARQPRATNVQALKPTANLRYLDVAVLLELWREWGLDEIFDELMPTGEAQLRPASVLAALSIQRCLDPGSKLYAARWLPRTALVELLELAPQHFNNTRLHRVLDDLDEATLALMGKLPRRYAQRQGAFASLFLDVTDAWFVGDGPSMAERGKTKEGRVQRKIGIVLLCNEHGYPLRWEVISGTQADCTAMTRTMRSVAGLRWVGEAPVVCDRAMGKTAQIREMLATGLRFLTALTVTEFEAYAQSLPPAPLALLEPSEGVARAEQVQRAAQWAQRAHLHKITDDQYMLDLGIVERTADRSRPADCVAPAQDATIMAMLLSRSIEEAVLQGRYSSYAAAGRSLGIGKSLTNKYRLLNRLSEPQQRDVLEGKAVGCTLTNLIQVASIEPAQERQKAFDALLAESVGRERREPAARPTSTAPASQDPIRVHVVAYFNPDRFVEQRLRARKHLEQIESFVTQLNTKLSAPRCKQTTGSITAAVDRKLRQDSLLDAFELRITSSSIAGKEHFQVALILDQATWARRHRYDGFTVLVAHPDLPQSPQELCKLYRAKDAVEKDFQIIKSVVELRPVWHRTDAKVRAHVTLCMLALLLERTLQQRLKSTPHSAEAALEILESCRLNTFAGHHGPAAYSITHIDEPQRAILRALKLLPLADDDLIADRISPR